MLKRDALLVGLDQVADVWLGYTFWGVLSCITFHLYSYSLLVTGISALSVVWIVIFLLSIPVGFLIVARFALEFLHIFRLGSGAAGFLVTFFCCPLLSFPFLYCTFRFF